MNENIEIIDDNDNIIINNNKIEDYINLDYEIINDNNIEYNKHNKNKYKKKINHNKNNISNGNELKEINELIEYNSNDKNISNNSYNSELSIKNNSSKINDENIGNNINNSWDDINKITRYELSKNKNDDTNKIILIDELIKYLKSKYSNNKKISCYIFSCIQYNNHIKILDNINNVKFNPDDNYQKRVLNSILSIIKYLKNNKYNDNIEEHMQINKNILLDVKSNNLYLYLGFQNISPITDFRNSGLLELFSIYLFLYKNYNSKSLSYIVNESKKCNYNFAIIILYITKICYSLLQIYNNYKITYNLFHLKSDDILNIYSSLLICLIYIFYSNLFYNKILSHDISNILLDFEVKSNKNMTDYIREFNKYSDKMEFISLNKFKNEL